MKFVFKEAWLVFDIRYSHGGERWVFHETEPSYVDEAYDAKANATIPGKVKRIFYCDADNATPEETKE